MSEKKSFARLTKLEREAIRSCLSHVLAGDISGSGLERETTSESERLWAAAESAFQKLAEGLPAPAGPEGEGEG